MSIEPKKMYECGGCNELHEFHHAAEDCCRPDIETVWQCRVCKKAYGPKEAAAECCAGAETICPACFRDRTGEPMQQAAVAIAGHCSTCNPAFTPEQQFAIEDLHFEVTGDHDRLNA